MMIKSFNNLFLNYALSTHRKLRFNMALMSHIPTNKKVWPNGLFTLGDCNSDVYFPWMFPVAKCE